MLLKTRIRVYREDQAKEITAFLLDNSLAQNVTREQQFLTGDFVMISSDYFITMSRYYLDKVKSLNEKFNVESEIVVG